MLAEDLQQRLRLVLCILGGICGGGRGRAIRRDKERTAATGGAAVLPRTLRDDRARKSLGAGGVADEVRKKKRRQVRGRGRRNVERGHRYRGQSVQQWRDGCLGACVRAWESSASVHACTYWASRASEAPTWLRNHSLYDSFRDLLLLDEVLFPGKNRSIYTHVRDFVLTYLEDVQCCASELHALPRSPFAVDDAVVLTVKNELNERIQCRSGFEAVPLFTVGVRNRHVGRDGHLCQRQS